MATETFLMWAVPLRKNYINWSLCGRSYKVGRACVWAGPPCGRGLCVCVEPWIKPDFGFCFGAPDNRRCFDYPDSGKVALKATDLQRKQDLMKSRKESRTVQHARKDSVVQRGRSIIQFQELPHFHICKHVLTSRHLKHWWSVHGTSWPQRDAASPSRSWEYTHHRTHTLITTLRDNLEINSQTEEARTFIQFWNDLAATNFLLKTFGGDVMISTCT